MKPKLEQLKIGDIVEARIHISLYQGEVVSIDFEYRTFAVKDGSGTINTFHESELVRIIQSAPNRGFYVFRKNGGAPSRVHATEDSARNEAERLSKQNPGAVFQVLEIVAECKTKPAEIAWSDGWENLPF